MKECLNCGGEHEKRGRFCCSNCQIRYWHKANPDSCRRARKKFYSRVSKEFNDYKEKIGCTICGYNKCGASLDYHHIGTKNFTVNAEEWRCNNERVRKEITRCILLCKNCHSELHYMEEKK